MLKLRHVFFDRRLLGKIPGEHKLGFEDGPAALHPSIEGGRHPAVDRMSDMALDIGEDLTGIGFG